MIKSNPSKTFLIVTLFISIVGCSTTKPVVSDQKEEITPQETVFEEMVTSVDLNQFRIRPESVFISVENSIPEEFQVEESQTAVTNPNSGFRIQIISTADVSIAERLQREFVEWQSAELHDYEAATYLQFRQPFYRLHVGNFRSRAQAIEFSRVVKRKFPDAWVVFDTIDPTELTVRKPQ
jgi:hypothetical protein